MPGPHFGFFARFQQPITSILPDCFKEAIANLPTLRLRQHQRLIDERRQQIENVGSLYASACADGLDGLQGPPSGKR